MSKTGRLPPLRQIGQHLWEALLQPGWFECQRCGAHGTYGQVWVVPQRALRLACAERCRRLQWQGYQ